MASRKRPTKTAKKQSTRARSAAKADKTSRKAARKTTGETSASVASSSTDSGDPQVARIQSVIDMMVRNGAVEVELEEAGKRLRVRLKEDVQAQTIVAHPAPASAPVVLPSAPSSRPATEETEDVAEGEVFVSPMVRTFYRAPAPEAEPFVDVRQRVTPDTTLCVIEAMKVMNEIKAEMEGQITAILVENGEPVEFGQPLFRITG